MSAIERLERLERMALLAKDLRRMIRKELAKTQKQVNEIEATIREGEERCRAFDHWDGKQPDTWIKAGKTWRKPTHKDIGKMVRVTMQLGVNPEKLPEAELASFTLAGEPITKGTKGEGVCWSYAWIECDRNETIESDGKGHITIQVEGVDFGTPRKIEQPAPQPDLLIDEESFLKPEPGTVSEEKWRPQIGDWVRIKKCKSSCCWVGIGMDYLDGQIRQVEELTTDAQGIVVDCFWLCDRCIEPWEPRPGEKVQVINENRVYEVQNFDKTTKMVFCVDRYLGIELRLLKPYIGQPAKEPETIARYDSEGRNVTELAGLWTEGDTQYRNPTQADLANGPIEVEVCDAQTGDDHWETRTLLAICPPNIWSRYVTAYPDCTESTQTWRFARIKVDEPAKEPEPQYRTPHPCDVGKRIEVRDSEDPTSDDSAWRERTLVAVLSLPGKRPQGNFVTAVEGRDAKDICHTWKYARVKVEG